MKGRVVGVILVIMFLAMSASVSAGFYDDRQGRVDPENSACFGDDSQWQILAHGGADDFDFLTRDAPPNCHGEWDNGGDCSGWKDFFGSQMQSGAGPAFFGFSNNKPPAPANCWYTSAVHMDSRDGLGVALGGYMYKWEIEQYMNFRVQSGAETDSVHTYAIIAAYPADPLTGAVDFSSNGLDFAAHVDYFDGDPGGDHHWSYHTMERRHYVNPGIWYVFYIVNEQGSNSDSGRNSNNDEAGLVNFWPYTAEFPHAEPISGVDYLQKYDIYPTPLPSAEIRERYQDEIDFDGNLMGDFCTGGGYLLVEDKWNSNRRCCGDDASDIGYVYDDGSTCAFIDNEYVLIPFLGESEDDFSYCKDVMGGDILFGTTPSNARDGSDGCCGDDPSNYCRFTYSTCRQMDGNPSACNQAVGCNSVNECGGTYNVEQAFTTCQGYTETGFGSGRFCNGNEPNYCWSGSIDIFGTTVDGCVPRETYDCQDMSTSECSAGCSVVNECRGSLDRDETTASTCDPNSCSGNCELYTPNNADIGYIQGDDRYYCDESLVTVGETERLTLSSKHPRSTGEKEWRWWDARELDVPYTIMPFTAPSGTNRDFVSNSKEWFYCSLGDGHGSGATRVRERRTFNNPFLDGKRSCAETLTAIEERTQFFSTNLNAEGQSYHFPAGTIFNNCEEIDGLTYCCKIDATGNAPGYDQGSFGFADGSIAGSGSICLQECYLANQFANLEDTFGDFGLLDAFALSFCSEFGYDDWCKYPEYSEAVDEDVIGSGSESISDCGYTLEGCLTETFDTTVECDLIGDATPATLQGVDYEGISCSPRDNHFTYCLNDRYTTSSDYIAGDIERCCLARVDARYTENSICGYISEDDVSDEELEAWCTEHDGDYLSPLQRGVGAYCTMGEGAIFKENCCVGGNWEVNYEELAYGEFTNNASFVCYGDPTGSVFAECCTDYGRCNNRARVTGGFSAFGSFESTDSDYGYYGRGGVLHTLNNYDNWNLETYTNSFRTKLRFRDGNPETINILDGIRINTNWNNYQALQFDIAYNLRDEIFVDIIDNNDDVCTFNPLGDYLTNGDEPFRWRRAYLPLEACESEIDLGSVKQVRLRTNYALQDFEFFLDNMFLYSDGSSHTENLYCTGDFGTWVEDLDGTLGDTGYKEVNPEPRFETTGPYKYACDEQRSFAWTGGSCCGDDTFTKYNRDGTQAQGEYYADSEMGCFSGNPVFNNWIVSDTLRDPAFAELLYYEGNFYSCGSTFAEYVVSHGDNVTEEPLVDSYVEPFGVVGTWVCQADDTWVDIAAVKKTQLLASTMYNFTILADGTQYPGFDLLCDTFDRITPYDSKDLSAVSLAGTDTLVTDSCVLRLDPDLAVAGDDLIVVGLGYELSTSAEEALKALQNHLLEFDLVDDSDILSASEVGLEMDVYDVDGNLLDIEDIAVGDEVYDVDGNLLDDATVDALINFESEFGFSEYFTKACNRESGLTQIKEFYQLCEYSYKDLRMAYNADFKLLLISVVEHETVDFEGFFNINHPGFRGFIIDIWEALTGQFFVWFGNGKVDGTEATVEDALLPGLSTQSARLDSIYVSKRGDKFITGLLEKQLFNPTDEDVYATVKYVGFDTINVEPLAERYYNEHFLSVNYYVDEDTGDQYISIVDPEMYRQARIYDSQTQRYRSNPLAIDKYIFEPAFDWATLTTRLDVE